MAQIPFQYPDGTSDSVEAPDNETARILAQQKVDAWAARRRGGRGDDFLGAALEGLTGGFLDEASGGVGALIGAMLEGKTLAQGYRQGYEGSKSRREGFAARNPKTSAALEIGGSIGSAFIAPEIKAAQALGIGGRLAPRLVNAAASGAGYGGLAGAGYAESPQGLDSTPGEVIGSTLGGAATGALVGSATGGATEAALAGIGRGYTAGRRALAGDTSQADVHNTIGRKIMRDRRGMSVDDLVNEMRGLRDEGYPVVVGDMGGVRTRGMARAAADISPEAQAPLEAVTGPRYRSQGGRTQAAIERESGGVGEETRYGMGDRIRAAEGERGALYDEAYQRGDEGIPWSMELADLAHDDPTFRDVMRTAAQRLQQRNNAARSRGGREWDIYGREPRPARGIGDNSGSGSGPRGTLAYWDQVKRELDRRIRVAGTNEGGRQTEEAGALDMMRRTLVEHLDSEVPSYAHARGRAHDLFEGRSALEMGEHAFDINMDATGMRRAIGELTPSEQRLFQVGWISKMQTHVRQIKDRTDIGEQIAASDQARDQLEAVFGRGPTQRLIRHRDIEMGLNRLHREVTGNSKTARYQVGIGSTAAGAAAGTVLGGPILGTLAGMGVSKIAARLQGVVNERAARWIAEALTSGDPEMLRRVMTAARSRPAIRQAISKLTRAAGGTAVGAYGVTQE